MRNHSSYPVAARLTRISLAALLLSVCTGCSEAFRFSDNPFSNPFVARADTTSTGTIRQAPRQATYRPAAVSSSRIVSAPLPAPGTPAIQQLRTQPARSVAAASARPPLLAAPATTGSIKRVGTFAKEMPGWSTKGGTPVTLTHGETVETVANRYGVPAPVLLHVNGLPNSGAAVPGQTLIIPTYSAQRTSEAPMGQGLPAASLAALIESNPFVRAAYPTHLAFAGEAEDGPRIPLDAGDVLAYSEQDTPAQTATRKVRSVSSIAAPISIKPPAQAAIVKTPIVKAAASKPAAKVHVASGPIKAARPKTATTAQNHIVPAAPKVAVKTTASAHTTAAAKPAAVKQASASIGAGKAPMVGKSAVKAIAKAPAAKPQTKVLAEKAATGKAAATKTAAGKAGKVRTVEVKPLNGKGTALNAPPKAIAKADTLPPDVSSYAADPAATGSLPPTAVPPTENGLFRWPAKGRVISGFGSKDLTGTNNGINISMPEGTPVKAAEAGTVAYSGDDIKRYGKLVLIKHENGYVSAYAHNGELDVRKGEAVKRGQIIAKSGSTGDVTSPQLHFQLRKGEQPVDPMKLLDTN